MLKRDDEPLAEEQAQLIAFQLVGPFQHAGDDKQSASVLLDFGALVVIHHVFERQRMQAENLPQPGHDLGIAQPLDVDPGDRVLLDEFGQVVDLGQSLHFALDEVLRVIGHDAHDRLLRGRIGNQCARGAVRRAALEESATAAALVLGHGIILDRWRGRAPVTRPKTRHACRPL